MRKNKDEEFDLQVAITDYLDRKYPAVLYRSDMAGVKLPIGLAVKLKKIQKEGIRWPDLTILEPRGRFYGLILELKKNWEELYTKKGAFRETEHIKAQSETLSLLSQRGYMSTFACGIDEAMSIIDEYMGLRQ